MSKRSPSTAASVAPPGAGAPALLFSACGLPADVAWEPISAGPCNRVFKVHTREGVYALKWYGESRGAAARFLTEQAWYELLRPWAPAHLPEPVVWNAGRRCVLFKWVEGDLLAAGDLTPAVLADLLAFLSAIHRVRPAAVGRAFPPAAGACFSLWDRLDAVGRLVEKTARQLSEMRGAKTLVARWESAWQVVMGAILSRAARAGLAPRQVLPLNQRMLAAPDWGLHQAVRAPGGRVVFFDFDGAGWEDPAWWLASLFARWELALPWEWWGALMPAATRLLGVESHTLTRAALLLPAARFQQLCAATEAAGRSTPPAARKRALTLVEAALTELARLEWWPAP